VKWAGSDEVDVLGIAADTDAVVPEDLVEVGGDFSELFHRIWKRQRRDHRGLAVGVEVRGDTAEARGDIADGGGAGRGAEDMRTAVGESPIRARDVVDPAGPGKNVAYVFITVLVVYTLVRGTFGAAAKPIWIDEFCTLAIASQSGIHGIWNAIRSGIDSAPPLFYVIEAGALKVTSNKEIALRLPAILAFPCTLVCVFALITKYSGNLIACCCAFVMLSTSLFSTLQTDARSYSMVMACVAFALVCYQRLPSRPWVVLFAASLVVAESLHYFAVFAMIPFWIAEGLRALSKREVRLGAWLGLVAGVLPLAVFWPLISNYRAYYGSRVVLSNPTLAQIPDFYGAYFLTDRFFGVGLAMVCLAAIVWSRSVERETLFEENSGPVAKMDVVVVVALTVLPVIAFALVRVMHAILISRYVLATTIGIVLGIAGGLSLVRPKVVALFFLFVLTSVGLREYSFWRTGHHPVTAELSAQSLDELGQVRELIQSVGHQDLPVVFDQENLYPQAVYYLPPDWTSRLVFLIDEEREFRHDRNDTGVKIEKALSRFYRMQLVDYTEFTRSHADFLLYAEPEGWILTALYHEGASAQVLKIAGSRWIYRVTMNGGAGALRKTSLPGSGNE